MTADEARAAYIDGLQKLVERLRADERSRCRGTAGTGLADDLQPAPGAAEGLAEVIRALGGEGWRS